MNVVDHLTAELRRSEDATAKQAQRIARLEERLRIPTTARTVTTREGLRNDPETETLIPVLNDQGGERFEVSHGITGTLRAHSKGNEPIIASVKPVAFKIRGGVEVDSAGKSAGKGYLGSEDKALTLGASQDQYLAEPIAFDPGAGQHGTAEAVGLAPTLKANGRGRVAAAIPPPEPVAFHAHTGTGDPSVRTDGKTNTLANQPPQAVAIPIQDARNMEKAQNGLGVGNPADPSYTLTATGGQAVAFALRGRDGGVQAEISGDRINALRASEGGSTRDYIATIQNSVIGRSDTAGPNGAGFTEGPTFTLDTLKPHAVAFAENSRAEVRLEGGDGQRTGALSTGGGKPGQGHPTIATAYSVRRLTPRETERLQAFPDDWARHDPDGREIPDTHRYRMMGNAVTVSVIAWIARRARRLM